MEVIHYFEQENREQLLVQLSDCDWGAARFLVGLLQKGTFFDTLGGWGTLYLLVEQDTLIGFATLTDQDCIRDEDLTPWIGFVFVKPEYRGHRFSERLLRHCEQQASRLGRDRVYIATDHVGLYEAFGYCYMENRVDYWGEDTRILYKAL